ncbi:ABC transporter ATP-binding protein [Paenibacillus sambharensis]|uniref:ABC transporter ATP-binding protein n=1 Tax=Paenibacillus sambharensis TaxID=1803190 RepID=A0A2W1LIK8_9BACL|nr:ABC transporter ATP-binding protein [Paenibacillus sambharensis]PZD94404.1 ABC transporter ATP-binding protein [Paenibacillus sambharensis]
MGRLAVYLKPYRAAVLLAPLLMILEVCMDLLQPRLMASIVNNGIMEGDLSAIWATGMLMIGAAIIGLIGGFGCTVYSSKAALGFGADLRLSLFRKVQTYSFDNLDRFSAGSLVTRLTGDVVQLQNMVQMSLRMFVRDISLTVGSIVMMFMLNARLALILVIIVPLLILILVVLGRFAAPLFGRVQERLDKVNTVLQENLSGIRVVKAFVRERFERSRFGRANTDYLEMALKAARTIALGMPLMMLVLNFGIVAVIWFGGISTWDSDFPVGNLAAFISYMTQMLFAMMALGMQLVMFSRAKASADRVNEVLEEVPGIADRQSAKDEIREGHGQKQESGLQGSITFDNVTFAYGKEEAAPVLKDITLHIRAGETVGILGATGSGKTSLVSLIPRLYDVTEGAVLIDGVNVKDMDARQLRSRIGMVLQQAVLFTGTIRDNIRFGRPEATEEEVMEAARAAQAHDFIMKLPAGYDTELGQRGVNLSGGQKQRISIARALILKPDILILDDSTSAVDLTTEARIQQALGRMMEGCTRVVIAQRISSVEDADRIIVLENGALSAIGTHDELMRTSSVYQEIYASQQRKEAVSHG